MLETISPARIKRIMEEYNLAPHKGMGQNFLVDANIRDKIVSLAEVKRSDLVLEIGPGLGVLTEELVRCCGLFYAVELDRGLYAYLRDKLSGYPHVNLICGDALKLNLKAILEQKGDCTAVKVVSNLPYNISTPLIMKLLQEDGSIDLMVLMVQRELAERLVSGPGSRTYGAASVLVQFYTECEIAFHVPRTAFYPVPKVDSTVLWLKPKTGRDDVNKELFSRIVRAAFAYRRKTLRNSLVRGGFAKEEVEEALRRAGIDPSTRAERLSLKDYISLALAFDPVR